jgi:hypothetical protein
MKQSTRDDEDEYDDDDNSYDIHCRRTMSTSPVGRQWSKGVGALHVTELHAEPSS